MEEEKGKTREGGNVSAEGDHSGEELPRDNRDTDVMEECERKTGEIALVGEEKEEGMGEPYRGEERRKHQRVKVRLHMIYEDGTAAIKTNVLNISMGGAFLELPQVPPKGAEIRLVPVIPHQSPNEKPVELKGRVVRVVEYNLPDTGGKIGVGIQFTNLTEQASNVLSEIFRRSVEKAKGNEQSQEGASATKQFDEISKAGK